MKDNRISKANEYEKNHGNQQKWYSERAKINKRFFQWLGILVVIIGATIGIIPIFGDPSMASVTEKVTAVMGGMIVILKGIERIWLPAEKWLNYRKASEALKREKELYVEGIAIYNMDDEQTAYKLYVNRCIQIKSEEQNNFWGLTEIVSDPQTIEKLSDKKAS